ncbi:MAG: CDP-diacylglycerol--serine O-phosphatidyltransferase [Myxococcota bacterium]|jgi:CDP-diacylglycerol--serine O-phosphatidyltransferase
MAAPVSRWKYVPPNAVTCTGMVVGLYSISLTFGGDYVRAAWMILLCVLIDKLDGSVARALKASSRFGVELDSFSDFLTFCVAPGLLYMGVVTGVKEHAQWWGDGGLWFVRFACAFYIVMGALRLAKFNILTEEIGGKIFLGVPTTLCGGLNACWALTIWKYDLSPTLIAAWPIALVVLGLWMVSNVPMPKVGKTGNTPFNIFLLVQAIAVYTLVPMQLFPEYLLLLSFIWLFVGTAYAVFVLREGKPVPEDGRDRLLELLKELSYQDREVTLASGAKSNFYIDCRNTSLHPEGIVLVGAELLDLLQDDGPEFDAVAGPSIGADPLVSGILVASHERKTPIPGMFVRKEPKAHGTQQLLEGTFNVPPGSRVAIVEDVLTTGGSALRTVFAVRDAGYEVVRLVALVDREEGGLQRIINDGKIPATALFRKADFVGPDGV